MQINAGVFKTGAVYFLQYLLSTKKVYKKNRLPIIQATNHKSTAYRSNNAVFISATEYFLLVLIEFFQAVRPFLQQ